MTEENTSYREKKLKKDSGEMQEKTKDQKMQN